MCLFGLRFKKHIFFHILYIIVSPLCPAFLKRVIFFTKLIVLKSKVCSDWPAIQCFVIGWIPQACDGNVTPLTVLWCRVSRSTETKKTLVNTPDSDNQLVRSELCAWTVFPLIWSLHSVHCSLHLEQGKSVEVYLTSEHSFTDLSCATSSHTDKCDIIYLCK